ncbi:MAG: acetyl-CoA carboxylase, biotin carboxyl carrier protein [Halobacteriovorax sp.]|nr:acetyl-CoA carboxylase, biotin carboxyl carrier protein [Halobacteriovorax sp.]|tara:strand:+ start:470036 stop:470476 length:441 start_codon:yes stop_codon:yes gene_type:complete
MKLKDVESLIGLAKDNGLAELSYKDKEGVEIKVKMTNGIQSVVSPVVTNPQIPVNASPGKSAPAKDPSLKEITSPFVGTFYRSSSPESEAYVKQGQSVSNGQVLCIVEAMKIMNEIESDFSGEIVEICVENETYVEFGQVLFRIKA